MSTARLSPIEVHPENDLRRSFADSANELRSLVDPGFWALVAVLCVPRADTGMFSAGVALPSSRVVMRRFQAHFRAIIDEVILKTPNL